MDGLVLSVPEKTLAWPIDLRSRKTRHWVEQLPIADSVQTARQLYRTVYHLNRSRLQAEERLELMELYVEPTATVSDILSVHLEQFALPLGGKKRRLAGFLRELHMEMAYGYKTVVQDLVGQRHRDDALLVTAIHRAIEYLGDVLARSYRVYVPYPSGVWRELHALYEYAEHHGYVDAGVDGSAETIRHRYLEALLLGVAGPYQMIPNDCKRVEVLLQHTAFRARLGLCDPGDHRFRFVIDLKSDAPPAWMIAEYAGASLRVLETGGLVRFFSRVTERLAAGAAVRDTGLGLDMLNTALSGLLERLARAWSAPPVRRAERVKGHGTLAVCTGFKAAHFFLTGQAGVDGERPEAETLLRHETEDYLDLDSDEPRRTTAAEYFRVLQWLVRDEGPAGLLLARDGSEPLNVQAGDLVVVERDPGGWQLGVARWLKTPDPDCLEMGVEILSVRPKAVFLDTTAGRKPGILVDGVSADALITRPGTISLGSAVRLLRDDSLPEMISLSKVLEHSPSFEHLALANSAPPLLN
ncbi:MAG: hypothetical protein ACYCP0_01040 [Acidiferrobacteraceae bacterium]